MNEDYLGGSFQPIHLPDQRPRGAWDVAPRAGLIVCWALFFVGFLLIVFGWAGEYYLLPLSGSALALLGTLLMAFCCAYAAQGARLILTGWRRRRQVAKNPDRHWLADYPWDPQLVTDDNAAKLRADWGGLLAGCSFAVPLHWLTLSPYTPLWARIPLGILTVILDVWLIRQMRLRQQLRLKEFYQIELSRFPFFLNDDASFSLTSSPLPQEGGALTATLRCLEERLITTKRRGRILQRVEVWEIYREVQIFDAADLKATQGRLNFFIPGESKATALSRRPPRYWELLLSWAAQGGDSQGSVFLLPIYSPVPD